METNFSVFPVGCDNCCRRSFILEVIFELPLRIHRLIQKWFRFLAAVVIAPVVEEFTKPLALGLKSVKYTLDELEDGFDLWSGCRIRFFCDRKPSV